jgi:hypothetical protein
MKAIYSCETSVDFRRTTRRYIPEGRAHHLKKLVLEPGCSWEDNIKLDLTGTGFERMEWIHGAQCNDQWLMIMAVDCIQGGQIL